MDHVMTSDEFHPTKKRYSHLKKALELVIQRTARKWTYEEFKECFPLFVEDDPSGAFTKYTTIQDYIETQNMKDMGAVLAQYNVLEKMTLLDKVTNEAWDRYVQADPHELQRKDLWREDLNPRQAMCSRTVPRLEKEVQYLRTKLAKMEQENLELGTAMEENVNVRNTADAQTEQLCSAIAETVNNFHRLPMEDYTLWTVETEAGTPESLRG